MEPRGLSVIVLAAGDGSRMHSARPKPLHRLCGRPMVRFVLDAVEHVDPRRVVVVVGREGQRVAKELADVKPVTDIVDQVTRGGTADAVRVGLGPLIDDDLSVEHHDDDVLVVPGDVPLVRGAALRDLVEAHRAVDAAASVLVGQGASGGDSPRIVRTDRDGSVARVTPHDDLVGREHEITEFATGIWCVRRALLAPAIRRLHPDPETGEISLAGIAEVLATTGNRVEGFEADTAAEVIGINDRIDLANAEAALRTRINESWLRRGVTMFDPAQTYVDATVMLAPDVSIFPGAILQGGTTVGEGTEIGPGCRLIDTRVGEGCRLDHTTAELASIGDDCLVGPYAVLSPGAEIPTATVTGPFYTAGADGP